MSSWILTAARCVHHGHVGVNGVVGIRIGVTNFDDKEQGTLVKKRSIHIHPYFKADVSYALTVNDIAIMQLEKHLEFGPHVHPVGVAFQVKIKHNWNPMMNFLCQYSFVNKSLLASLFYCFSE